MRKSLSILTALTLLSACETLQYDAVQATFGTPMLPARTTEFI